jgi:Tfp pilus assembly protein PilF
LDLESELNHGRVHRIGAQRSGCSSAHFFREEEIATIIKLSRLFPAAGLALLVAEGARADTASPASPAVADAAASAQADDRDEAALARVNAALRDGPSNASAYLIRGNIYGTKELWDLAQENYEEALRVDPNNIIAKVNLAEMAFRQKKYDLARSDFVALETNGQIGDLAGYKVFLCDLFGAHESAAQQELQVFDSVGENASYYFGNIAWDLVHHQATAAENFMASAEQIYAPQKVELYAASLLQLGYLPLPVASASGVR